MISTVSQKREETTDKSKKGEKRNRLYQNITYIMYTNNTINATTFSIFTFALIYYIW